MSLKLPLAPEKYDRGDQTQMRGVIERADQQNLKRGETIILTAGQRIVIPDESTGALYRLKVSAGVLSIVAYP